MQETKKRFAGVYGEDERFNRYNLLLKINRTYGIHLPRQIPRLADHRGQLRGDGVGGPFAQR